MVASSAWSIPYFIGNITVDVEVRNIANNVVPDAKVSVQLYGKQIYVKVRAAGYQSQETTISLADGTTYYKRDFSLRDQEKKFSIRDLRGHIIDSAFLRTDQFGFEPNLFGITIFIPIKDWPQATPERMDVFDGFWGIPLKTSCEITTVEEFYQIRITITRRAVTWTTYEMDIVFNTKEKLEQPRVKEYLARLEKLEQTEGAPLGGEATLAKFISMNIPVEQLAQFEYLPTTLQAFVDQAKRFAKLHRE